MKKAILFALLVVGLAAFSSLGLALQPRGSVEVYDVGDIGTIAANESTLVLNDTDFSVYQAPGYVSLPLETITEIESGVFNITANISFMISYTNSSATDVLLLTYDYPGNNSGMIKATAVSDNATAADCSISSDDGNTVAILCSDWTTSEGSETFTINVILEWNVTISTSPATYQLTVNPLIDLSTNASIDYVQNFTVKAPFAQNVSMNVTMPDENVTITSLSGNDTVAGRSGAYTWFTSYNVDTTGTSPQINMRAIQIAYLTVDQSRTQGQAITGYNVSWTTIYTIAYNDTYFKNLIAENLKFLHQLWPDSDVWSDNVTSTGAFGQTTEVPSTAGSFNGGYVNVTYPTFNYTNSSQITIVEWTKAPVVYAPHYDQYPAQTGLPVWWNESVNVTNPALENYENVTVITTIYPDINTSTLNFLGDPNVLNLSTDYAKTGETTLSFNISTLAAQTTNATYKFNFTTPAPTVSAPSYSQYPAQTGLPVWWNASYYVNNTAQEDYTNVMVVTTIYPDINTSTLNFLGNSTLLNLTTDYAKTGTTTLTFNISKLSAQTTNAEYKFNFTTPAPVVSTPIYSQYLAYANQSVWWNVTFYVNNTAQEDYTNVLVVATMYSGNTTPLNVLQASNQTNIVKSGTSLNWTIETLSAQTTNAVYKFNFTTPAPIQYEYVIGYSNGFWLKNITINNTFSEAPYLIFLNTTFKSLARPSLFNATGHNITTNIFWNDTDSDTYYEYVQWNYTIPAGTTWNFTINGTRWASVSASLSKNPVQPSGLVTVSGQARYMDNDTVANTSVYITIFDLTYGDIRGAVYATYTTTTNTDGRYSFDFYAPSYTGSYVVQVIVSDSDQVNATLNKTLTVQVSPAVFAKPSVTVPALEEFEIKTLSMIEKEGKITFEKSDEHSLVEISISVKAPIENVEVKVKKVTEPPTTKAPEGSVYHYIQVIENIADENVSQVKIKFKVEKAWIEDANAKPEDVVLERWIENEWVKLDTKKVSEDEKYVYYEALSPGLSYFAIVLMPKIEEKLPEEEAKEEKKCPPCPSCSEWGECKEGKQTRTCYKCDATTNYECQAYEETKSCEVKPSEKPPEEKPVKPEAPISPVTAFVLAIIAIIAGTLYYFFYYKKK
jgi:PGF-pre-PGF domain-containing protein